MTRRLQSFAGYLGLAVVFVWDGAMSEMFLLISVFRVFFCWYYYRDYILAWGLGAGLLFYGVLRSW